MSAQVLETSLSSSIAVSPLFSRAACFQASTVGLAAASDLVGASSPDATGNGTTLVNFSAHDARARRFANIAKQLRAERATPARDGMEGHKVESFTGFDFSQFSGCRRITRQRNRNNRSYGPSD